MKTNKHAILKTLILGMLAFSMTLYAEPPNPKILIVDFSDSISGEYIEKITSCNLKNFSVKRIVNPEDITCDLCENCNALILVRPASPEHYPENVKNALKQALSKDNTGLILWGLPEEKKDVEKLFEFIGKHAIAILDSRYPNKIDPAFWIWTKEKPDENQTVYFRKKFTAIP